MTTTAESIRILDSRTKFTRSSSRSSRKRFDTRKTDSDMTVINVLFLSPTRSHFFLSFMILPGRNGMIMASAIKTGTLTIMSFPLSSLEAFLSFSFVIAIVGGPIF